MAVSLIFIFYYFRRTSSTSTPLDKPSHVSIAITGDRNSQDFDNGGPLVSQLVKDSVSLPLPICGDRAEVTGLLIGIDYRGNNYVSGLADVIRVVAIDYTIPSVNVVSLPRDLLVTLPDQYFTIPGPIKLGQAYLFGTRGFDRFSGIADGAGALDTVIQHNFGLSAENYLVIDFQAFVKFIDAIGGIEVDLPTIVDDRPNAYFSAGNQLLNGEQALTLARARKNHGDPFRINSQNLIMQSVYDRVREPSVLIRMPSLLAEFRKSVMTDLTPKQVVDALCLIQNLSAENLHFFNPGVDLLTAGSEYLPTLNGNSFVWSWDLELANWIHEELFEYE